MSHPNIQLDLDLHKILEYHSHHHHSHNMISQHRTVDLHHHTIRHLTKIQGYNRHHLNNLLRYLQDNPQAHHHHNKQKDLLS